jgi:hypothetical protein
LLRRLVWTCIPDPDWSAHGLGMNVARRPWATATCLTMLLNSTVLSAMVIASAGPVLISIWPGPYSALDDSTSMPAPSDGVAHGMEGVLEFERVGERAVLDVLLHPLPIRGAQVELELGGHERIESQCLAPFDLALQHPTRCQQVRRAVGIEGVGERQRVAGRWVNSRSVVTSGISAVEVAAVHVDELVVGQVVGDVEDEHRVGDVDSAGQGAAEEPLDRHPLAAQVSLGVGCSDLDGVDAGGSGTQPGPTRWLRGR